MGKGWRVLDWPCWQCLAQDEPRVNWHRMPWFGVVWNESYGFLRRGCWDCYLVTVILVVWFVYLKIIDSHLKLFPPSILHIYKVFEYIDMLCIGIQQQPYTLLPTLLGSDFEVLGHLWRQNDVITSWLRLTAT